MLQEEEAPDAIHLLDVINVELGDLVDPGTGVKAEDRPPPPMWILRCPRHEMRVIEDSCQFGVGERPASVGIRRTVWVILLSEIWWLDQNVFFDQRIEEHPKALPVLGDCVVGGRGNVLGLSLGHDLHHRQVPILRLDAGIGWPPSDGVPERQDLVSLDLPDRHIPHDPKQQAKRVLALGDRVLRESARFKRLDMTLDLDLQHWSRWSRKRCCGHGSCSSPSLGHHLIGRFHGLNEVERVLPPRRLDGAEIDAAHSDIGRSPRTFHANFRSTLRAFQKLLDVDHPHPRSHPSKRLRECHSLERRG